MTPNSKLVAVALEVLVEHAREFGCDDVKEGEVCSRQPDNTDCYSWCVNCFARHQLQLAAHTWKRLATYREDADVTKTGVAMALSVAATGGAQ